MADITCIIKSQDNSTEQLFNMSFLVFIFRKAFSAPIKLPLEKILDFVDKVLSMDVSSVVGQGQGYLSRSPICHEDSRTFCINIKYLSLFYFVIRKCMYIQKFELVCMVIIIMY